MNQDAFSPEAVRRGRRTLVGLAALFFVPLGISFWLYYSGGWRPSSVTNHGELITPALPLQKPALHYADGRPAPADLLMGLWTLVYIGDGQCDEACRQTLYTMRQTRLTLANDMTRVRRVFLATANCCNNEFLTREHPGLDVLAITDPAAAALVAQFPALQQSRSIYVVDPLGNLMMRFDARQPPKGLQQDLVKLLKLSHIG